MSAIFISEFSSLNFRKDWKLSFQQNVDYIPKFLPTDNIQVQYVVKDFTLTPYLKNICTGEVKQLSPVLLLENESEKCYQLTINNSSISSDTEFNLYFASDQDGEKIKDANFCVCTELPDTILLEYTNRKNVYETIFDGIDRFLFRVEGAFLPQEISFENNTEEFRDQRYVSKILSSTAFEKKTLTLGGGMGVPNWVARKINLIFSLSSVHVEGTPMVRSDGGAVELTEIGKYYPLYIYKIVLEDGEDNEDTGDGIIEYLRAVDEKKKIIRKSSENDLRVYLEGTGIDTAKMIRELELIGELSMNYTIEIDDNLSGSTNKTTLQSLIQFISKDFVTNNKFKEYIDQPVRTTDDVKFNSVVAKESIKTGKVTAEEVVSENFTSGLLGVGHRLWNGVLEISELIVRKTMHVFEIIVQKVTSVNGSMLTTPGGGVRISEVEELEDGYKCLFNNDDGTIPNPFIVGDQALHQVFTGKNIGRYWRLVTEVGDNYFVLSKTDCEAGSGIPQVEDEIIQFGNRTDKNRQNAVLTTSYGSDAPYTAYYSNVNSYSLEGKEDVREGNLRGINDPDFGQLQGSGFYGKNVYLKGIFRLLSGKTVEESIGDVQSNLDNLQVGETNLLDNSNKGWKNTGYPIATIYLGDYKPKKGEECTIVIKGKLGANKTNWAVYNSGGNVRLASFYPGGPDTDYIALKTFKWTLTPAIDNTFIRIYPMPNSVSVESEIEWVKLVLGNKTSLLWTPSINDQKQIATDIAQAKADLAETRANAYADGIVTEAEQNAINEAQTRLDALQIGSQNLISKKMMLKWNEKNKDIAVWGQDEDGVYLNVNHKLLTDYVSGGLDLKDVFGGAIKFKTNTQYVFSVEWKVSANGENDGIRFIFLYTDGSIQYVSLKGNQTTKARINYVTDPGKTISKISSSHGFYAIQSLIYNISLIEGNKPLQGFPVAEEDQTGANNVNLADGTKGPFTVEGETNDYAYKALYMPVIKPNTVYYVNAQNIEFLSGNISKCDFILFDKAIKNYLTPTYHHLYDKNGGILITKNDFEAQEGYLLCYAGEAGATAGNSVRFTEVMLVEGFFPAQVWAPSFTEQQTGIDAANSAANAAQNAVMQVTKSLTELTAENGQIKASVKEVSQKVDTVKTDAEEFTLNNKGNGNNVATAITESFRIDGGYHILKLGVGKAGDIFTLSVETTKLVSAGSQAGKQMLIYTATSTASTYVLGRINATSSVKQIITFTLPQNMKDDIMICATEAWSGTNDVTKLKLEYGNKTTDWTPSTEDQNAITNKAKQEAIVTAAADATTKADAARNAAKSYTDDRTEPIWKGWIDASALDQTKYYPVVFYCEPGRRSTIRLEVALNSGVKPGWSTHASGFSVRCVWSVNGSGWGTTPIDRIIDDFAYSFANVIPAGDVGQMTNSSREYIYVRGGGKYYFVATNTGTPFLVTSDYTAINQTISVKTSVTEPSITNATKEELNAEINITKGLIENKVSLDVYNENDQLIKSDISNLQVSYNQISSTVSKIINGTQEISGVVTQSNFVTIFSSNKNALGQEVIESINVGGGGVTIDASRINLNGAISANGNVQITTDGKLIAVNGQFTGKITATEGEIAGLKLSNNGLRSSDFNASSKIGSCYAKNGFSVYASGSGILKPSTGGIQAGIITAVGDFISHITGLEIIAKETSYNSGSSSKVTALRIQAENSYYGTPFDPPLAIEVVSGDVLFGGKMTVNNTSIFRGQIYLNLNNIPNISGASNYYLCINRSTGQLSYR